MENKSILLLLAAVMVGSAGCGQDEDLSDCAQTYACSTAPAAAADEPTLRVSSQPRSDRVGFLIDDPREIKLAATVGAKWVRTMARPFYWGFVEPRPGRYDFSVPDSYVREGQKHDVSILANIWPYAGWDQLTCHDLSCVAPGFTYDPDAEHPTPFTCMPCSEARYKTFVRKLVERYDGDGVDDMRGLTKPITHWEILNEPEIQIETMAFFTGSPAEYVTLLRWSREAIHEACPSCKVLVGGASNNEEQVHQYHSQVLLNGGDRYFDVANIHFVSDVDYKTLNVDGYKNFLEQHGVRKPIWVTEVQFPSRTTENVVEAVKGAYAAGADKLFFVSFEIGKLHNGGDFTSFSDEYRTIVKMFP